MANRLGAIDVVMPTYNCAPWLNEFLTSLLAQHFSDWRIYVRDDASTDGTQEILRIWQARLGERMVIVDDCPNRNLGLIGNYNLVLAATTAQWVMSADPDDIWLPGKVAASVEAMRVAEEAAPGMPVALCTDAEVIDRNGRPIAESYWQWSRQRPEFANNLVRVAMESVALGSTMMMNRSLLQRALPIPADAPYQDWWLALVACASGKLYPVSQRTIRYRRHGTNATADAYGASFMVALGTALVSPTAPVHRLRKVVQQAAQLARTFVDRYRTELKPSDLAALECLANLEDISAAKRRYCILRHRLFFGSRMKTLGLLMLV